MENVLIVDDEDSNISLLMRSLEREGFSVDGAKSREEALEKMDHTIYPIVILDIKFPDTSGQELLKEFQEINPLVNVIMITGHSTIKNVIECLGEGAVDYFTKPLEMDELIDNVKEFSQRVDRWEKSLSMG